MIELVFTQHRGRAARLQQDTLLVADRVMQSADLPVERAALDPADGLCALADAEAVALADLLARRRQLVEMLTMELSTSLAFTIMRMSCGACSMDGLRWASRPRFTRTPGGLSTGS